MSAGTSYHTFPRAGTLTSGMSTSVKPEPKDAGSAPATLRSSVYSVDKKDSAIDSASIVSNDLLDSEPEPFRLSDWLFRRNKQVVDLDTTATRRSVYDDPNLAEHYWPKSNYENIHRFNPKARWTLREEQVRWCLVFISYILTLAAPGSHQKN